MNLETEDAENADNRNWHPSRERSRRSRRAFRSPQFRDAWKGFSGAPRKTMPTTLRNLGPNVRGHQSINRTFRDRGNIAPGAPAKGSRSIFVAYAFAEKNKHCWRRPGASGFST
jgi:hypothetical protein